jgi:hypothetical protein
LIELNGKNFLGTLPLLQKPQTLQSAPKRDVVSTHWAWGGDGFLIKTHIPIKHTKIV